MIKLGTGTMTSALPASLFIFFTFLCLLRGTATQHAKRKIMPRTAAVLQLWYRKSAKMALEHNSNGEDWYDNDDDDMATWPLPAIHPIPCHVQAQGPEIQTQI